MNRRSPFVKAIALVITGIFLWHQTGICQAGEPAWRPEHSVTPVSGTLADKVKLPYDLAHVDRYISPGSDELIVNIQDAHASLSAQYSISNILKDLVTEYDIRIIALEGADGNINTSLLRSIPGKEVRKAVADDLVREGRMGAGEFFSVLNSDKDVMLRGVEDEELYRKNLKSFCRVHEMRSEIMDELQAWREHLRRLSKKVFSRDLRKAEKVFRRHRKGEISFSGYWESVGGMISKAGISESSHVNIRKLLKVTALEKEIDFDKATDQRKLLLDRFGDVLSRQELEMVVLRTVSFKKSRISPAEYHRFLLQLARMKGVDTDEYDHLVRFSEYMGLYHSVDLVHLYREISVLEDRVRDTLYRNQDERRLNLLIRYTDKLNDLFNVELSAGGHRFLERTRAMIRPGQLSGFLGQISRRSGVRAKRDYDHVAVISRGDEALEFYELARERDNAMLANTVISMREKGKKAAALITGGYHSEGLSRLMKEKRLSYLVVAPKFEDNSERPYIAVLTNRKKPYEKAFEASGYHIAGKPLCADMTGRDVVDVAVRSLARYYLEGRDPAEKAGEWYMMYSAMYAQDQEDDPRGVEGLPRPSELAEVLGVGEHRGKGSLAFYTVSGDRVVARVKAKDPKGQDRYLLFSRAEEDGRVDMETLHPVEARRLIRGTRDMLKGGKKRGGKDSREYALRTAWWKEEAVYFLLPLTLFHLISRVSGIEADWGYIMMAAARGVYFVRHRWSM
ncbi:MAG: hypothetical protein GF392_02360, partial [Candidatus Omnitrophica bacterium]|nr:hypothetical protein [Candidatus Omnitrophota bacterium]